MIPRNPFAPQSTNVVPAAAPQDRDRIPVNATMWRDAGHWHISLSGPGWILADLMSEIVRGDHLLDPQFREDPEFGESTTLDLIFVADPNQSTVENTGEGNNANRRFRWFGS